MNASPTPATTPPTAEQRVRASMERQGLMQHLGVEVQSAQPGEVILWMPYSDRVTQQQGLFHGGALGALADAAGGMAGLSVAPDDCEVVAAEYKINFIGGMQGGGLRAVGRVIKPGRRLIVTAVEITHVADDGSMTPCAVMQQTLVPVSKTY